MRTISTFLLSISVGLFFVSDASAALRHSTYGGGQQFWLTGDDFASRSNDGGDPDFVIHPPAAANGAISGSAYHFYQDAPPSLPADQLPWWVQYNVPASSLPGSFNLTGTWYLWTRTTQPNPVAGDPAESDWVIVNGDPNDLNTSNPTDAQWAAGLNLDPGTERIVNDLGVNGNPFFNYTWGWVGEAATGGGSTLRPKTLAVVDGNVSWRIYEREAGPFNALIDVMVWSNNPNFIPTDADFQNAIPEPYSGTLLAVGVGLLLLRRRIRS